MKHRATTAIASAAVLLCLCLAATAEPMRGIELNPSAPDWVVTEFARSGINTVVIPFRRQGDLEDADFQKALGRWGKLCAAHKLQCMVVIRLFGPSDYTGCTKGYARGKDAVAGSRACVCPNCTAYWAELVVPRIRRISELAKQNGLAGVLFEYQATLDGHEYNSNFCYCNHCWGRFVESKCGGDKKIMDLSHFQRLNWLRTSGRAGEFFSVLQGMARKEMETASAAAREVYPDIQLGIYGYWDAWFFHAVAAAMSKEGAAPHVLLAEYEQHSFGRLSWLGEHNWKGANLDLSPVTRLPLDFYLPRDVQNLIAELDRSRHGFLLTSANSLWRQLADYYHVHPPHGSARAFAQAVRNGLSGYMTGKSIVFSENLNALPLPRIGLLHGRGISGALSKTITDMAESFQLPCLRLDTAKLDEWVETLPSFKLMIILPGAGAANPSGLAKAAPGFERFLKNGGLLLALNASDDSQLNWLAGRLRNLSVKGEKKLALTQAWLDTESLMLKSPSTIKKLEPLMWHFKAYAKSYTPLAKDNEGAPYLLAQSVGRGSVLVAAGPIITPDLIANAWFAQVMRGDPFTVGLVPGADEVRFGDNRLVLGVAEFPESASNVDVTVDVVDSRGRTATQQLFDISVAGDGIRLPLRYFAAAEGAGRIVVTISDPIDGALIEREFIDLIHDQHVEVLPDKNYYTEEAEARVRLRYFDPSLKGLSGELRLAQAVAQVKPGAEEVRFVQVPVSELPVGEHKLRLALSKEGKEVYTTEVVLRKEAPFPNPVKVLYHRSCVLEVQGKPFFPFGCYGIGPAEDEELAALGVNTCLGGKAGQDRKLMVVNHSMRHWALSKDWPPEKLISTLKTPDYARLLGYYMFDEPALNGTTPELLMKHYVSGRAKDPYHPQMSVYIGSMTHPLYPDYVPSGDCQMMDHYPLPYFEVEEYGQYLSILARACRERHTVWGVPQCFDWREIGAAIGPYDKETLHPSGEEALSFIYQSVVSGGGAITFWTYRLSAADPRRNEGFKKALAEGGKLVRLVADGSVFRSPEVKPFGARIRCRSFRVDDRVYIVASNATSRQVTVEFAAPYLKDRKLELWLPEQRQMDGLRDTFAPLQGKVYVIQAP